MCISVPAIHARSEYWHQRASLFESLPTDSCDIVFLGNSITDGGELAELLDNPTVKNRGINSDDIPGVMDRLSSVTSGRPAKIFLLIGINDVSHNLTASQLADSYGKLVERIRRESPSSRLYLQSVMPINNDFGRYRNLKGKEDVINEFNKRIKGIAEHNGAEYVDLWPALAEPTTGKLKPEFTNDGLHLLAPGYRAWMDVVREYVDE